MYFLIQIFKASSRLPSPMSLFHVIWIFKNNKEKYQYSKVYYYLFTDLNSSISKYTQVKKKKENDITLFTFLGDVSFLTSNPTLLTTLRFFGLPLYSLPSPIWLFLEQRKLEGFSETHVRLDGGLYCKRISNMEAGLVYALGRVAENSLVFWGFFILHNFFSVFIWDKTIQNSYSWVTFKPEMSN